MTRFMNDPQRDLGATRRICAWDWTLAFRFAGLRLSRWFGFCRTRQQHDEQRHVARRLGRQRL